MKQLEIFSLATLDNGGLSELAQVEFGKISKNIADPQTSPTAIRELIITIKFAPDKNRHVGRAKYNLKTKLAGPESIDVPVNFGIENGQFIIVEAIPPEQLKMWDDESPEKILRSASQPQ